MKESDMEVFANKPVLRSIIALALPSIIGQLILVIYNIADTFFVGLTNDNAMITAVTVCMPAFMFLSAISNLFGVGGSSVIARSLGRGNTERAKHASSFAFWGCLAVTILYCLFAFLLRDYFVDMLGGSNPDVHPHAVRYLIIAIVICGLPTAMNTLFSHLLRSQGMSLHASLGIGLGGVLNVALDPLFMFVLLPKGQEAMGAALATGISNVIALVYYVILFIAKKRNLIISISPSKGIFQNAIPKEVILVGLPACLMTLCENISYAVLDNLMVGYGLDAQTGIGVAKKINMFAHSAVRGMAQGVLPLIGFNKSSGNRKRMKKVVYISGGISFGIASLCLLVNYLLSAQLIGIFLQNPDNPAISFGVKFLQILSIGAPFSAIAYTVISFFQAVGKAWRSLILALLRKGILDIPLMLILPNVMPIEAKSYGLVWATPIADIACCLVAIALFVFYIRAHGHNKGEFAKKEEKRQIEAAI